MCTRSGPAGTFTSTGEGTLTTAAYTSRAVHGGGRIKGGWSIKDALREGIAIELSLQTHTHRGWTIVSVGGELDLYTAPQLRDAVAGVLEDDGPRIAIDLTDVGFIDSSGLGVIVSSLTKARDQGGDLALVAPPASSLTKLLTLIGLDATISTRASLDDLPDA